MGTFDSTAQGRLEKSQPAPFTFDYIERQLRGKTFGILSTVSKDGRPHSVGVVYGVSAPDQPFCLYLITRPVLKKARNISHNPNISFVVPFPHYILRLLPPACIEFQGRAEIISIDDPAAVKAFQSSIVLRRSIEYSLRLGESVFIRIVPDQRIFSFGIGAGVLKFLMASQNKNLGNYFVVIPESRSFDKP